jgi:hypothetical protein
LIRIANHGVGTIIGRRTKTAGKEYLRIWIYVPTKISEDSAFPFKAGDPCEIDLDIKEAKLVIKPIDRAKAEKQGWNKRRRTGRD